MTEVAAAVLTGTEQHAGATYELVAPGRYTAYDLARAISDVMGREIVPECMDSDVFMKAALGTDDLSKFPYQTRVARANSNRYNSHDFIGNPNVLSWLLGGRPTTWEQFVQREFLSYHARDRAGRGRVLFLPCRMQYQHSPPQLDKRRVR